MKVASVHWKEFYSDPVYWPPGAWYDDEEITIDGVEVDCDTDLSAIDDHAVVTVRYGVIYLDEHGLGGESLESHLRHWLKCQATATLLVEIDKERVDDVKAAIKALGGRVR